MLAAVERDDLDVAGLLDHVRVRERDPARIDDHARAEAPLWNAVGRVAEEALEELLAKEFLEWRPSRPAAGTALEDGVDVDDRRLDDFRDLGERARLERHLDREDRRVDEGRGGSVTACPLGGASRRERADAGAPDERENDDGDEGPSLEVHHAGASMGSPASARRRRSPSSVSVRFSSAAAETSTAFLAVRMPRTRSCVRSRMERTSWSMMRAVSSL